MQGAVGPFQIIERQNRFQVRKDRALISTHRNYLEAEDAALCLWLDRRRMNHDLILKKPRDGLLAFRLGTAAALRETDSVIDQLREQLRSERKQHALKLAEKERELAELCYQLAKRDTQDAFARAKSPVVHHRSIAHASAAIADCRNAALAEGIVSAFQAATDLQAPTTMVIATLRGSILRSVRIAHTPPGSAESADCRSLALGEGIVSAFQATTDWPAPSTMVSVALGESLWRGH